MLLLFSVAQPSFTTRGGCATVSSLTYQRRGGMCGQPAHTSPHLSPTSAPPRPHCLSLLLRPSPLHHLCSLTSRASSLFRPAPASPRRAPQPLPPVADILSYAAIEFRERAAVKSLEIQGSFGSKAKEEERGSTRGSRPNLRHVKGRWRQLLNQMDNFPSSMAASKGDEDPLGEHPDKLADRLVFYEKLFFQVDTSEQG